jgi:hypothetical protein
MGLTIGPATSHPSYVNWSATALGSTVCGGRLFCKSLGIAWIVAPAATQVSATWNGASSGFVGNKPCVSDWSSLNTALINGGLTPTQWFVPSISQLQSGYACRTFWDSFASTLYWSSTEGGSPCACTVNFNNGTASSTDKAFTYCVRAFRCVTY